MAYQVLARKWRPNRFSELVGQEHVVTAISNALDNNRLHHAYLFTGTRGVGKTTIARIFSKSLNCETGLSANPCGKCDTCLEIENGTFVDLLEIDAASRTKVEDTRELLDNVQYKPTRGQYKVYLIDEVHMLSKHSFNALLKTLEEPPPHVKFLLATTDPQKLPVTILSRCLQFNLKALSREQISQQLNYILSEENIFSEPQALSQLARAAQGSMRDALSLTDQAIAQGDGKVTNAIVTDMLGLMDKGQIVKLLYTIFSNDSVQVMAQVETMSQQSVNYEQVLSELMSLLHQVALTQFVPEACKLETVSARAIFQLAKMMPPEQVQLAYQIALQGKKDIIYASDSRVGLEMTLLRMLAFNPAPISMSIEETNSSSPEIPFSHTPVSNASAEKKTVEVDELNEISVHNNLIEQQNNIIEQADRLTADQSIESKRDEKREVSSVSSSTNSQQDHSLPDTVNHSESYENNDTYHHEPYDQPSNIADFHEDNFVNTSAVVDTSRVDAAQTHLVDENVSKDTPTQNHALSATENLIALKNKLAKLECATETEVKTVTKSDNDFLPSRFKTQPQVKNEQGSQSEIKADQNPQNLDVIAQPESEPVDSKIEDVEQPVSTEKNDKVESTSTVAKSEMPVQGEEKESIDNAELQHVSPPWPIDNVDLEKQTDDSQNSFDPMAHLNEPVEVNVDFEVPAFLENGEKVFHSHQLDTWSQLIEQMQVTALTKQLALHSSYEKNDATVTLKLLDSKPHLDTPTAREQLQRALSELFQTEIELKVEHAQPISTPFAVQQTINQVRMQHAMHIAETDPNINRIKDIFSAQVIETSIKPR
ncbi:DNA polymerase III subunit gamma/tau [Aliiglaciecola lipolytica]|uniref:DNA-directed DNA polymerase n=1 Tax=Aliiglaciecola lipolytica E3 TaxID=1127673 RepID=K6YEE9_9ALTE|nr:DNA polymerase III subunit gamma/tau [Aliiglaciecola lipolytica]GAC15013.1 DNA polymerase III subunit gamma/tau [Aliiglaciecola lipolytica E3]